MRDGLVFAPFGIDVTRRCSCALLVLAVSCGAAPSGASGQAPAVSDSPTPSATRLIATAAASAKSTSTAAPIPSATVPFIAGAESVRSDGRTYRIADAYLWRDFMPISEPGGKPLAVSIKVSVDSGTFPANATVDHMWVIGPALWEPAQLEVRRAPEAGTPPSQIEVFASGGPKWDPGREVDVVVRLRIGSSTYNLRTAGVAIQKTS